MPTERTCIEVSSLVSRTTSRGAAVMAYDLGLRNVSFEGDDLDAKLDELALTVTASAAASPSTRTPD